MYARHASDVFNHDLHRSLKELADDVATALGSNLVALILGGGYGRGEGGVCHVDGHERLYNDLDFAIVVRDKKSIVPPALEAVRNKFESKLKIEIDFSRPLTPRDIRCWPHTLMWHDLLHGHIVVRGAEDILENLAPSEIRQCPPPIEASRLLLNRGAGLLWSLRILKGLETAPDSDFVRRNYFKAALALGDALMICHQRYRTAYEGRDKIFELLEKERPELTAMHLSPLYAQALRFKFRPDTPEMGLADEPAILKLAGLWNQVFLLVESLRAQTSFASPQRYSQWAGVREPAQHYALQIARNLVLNFKRHQISWKYPREKLFRQLPVLLPPFLRDNVWVKESHDFLQCWKQFN